MSAYPTMEQVEAADIVALTSWVRRLPSPDDDDRPVLERIMARYHAAKISNPSAAVAASKAVGL